MWCSFQTHYKARVIKTVWLWWRSRQLDQWNRIESPDLDLYKYNLLVFVKEAKTVQWSKDSLFNKWCWDNWISMCKKKKNLDTDFTSFTKINWKGIRDLNGKHKSIKLLQDRVKLLSHVRLFVTPWTVAYQAPPSMGFSRQQYWSGLPFPSPGDLPNPGIEPGSPTL